ncbi:hypothetical protein E8E12_000580 [Didymella heteroderae]|uniref:PNPLA domain-containing protein n=1 Tax=Didymella heteroderae TaxID=1769908 RepID=A0A9P4WFP7_9PLEO|nr:hypothetical protein E8E12_000580 [Didymella heteroderae]
MEFQDFVAPYVAECLLLDNYSVDVHGFDPREVFSTHYKKVLTSNVGNSRLSLGDDNAEAVMLGTGFAKLVEQHFIDRSRPYMLQPRARADMLTTAGVRVLSLDGGGIRAKVVLQFLQALELEIGIDMPVQENFDFGFGTSSGSLVILALYQLGLRVKEADRLFTELSFRVFRGRNGPEDSLFAPLISCLKGRFPAADIDEALSDTFGVTSVLTHPYMTSIGARIGFPVVDADTSETRIVTSYNGASQDDDRGDRSLPVVATSLRSRCHGDDILITDA